jgi:hypothetical protein
MNDRWVVGYKNVEWQTIVLPIIINIKVIEMIIYDLNKNYDIVYMKIVNGISEKENHKTKKGEFIGL